MDECLSRKEPVPQWVVAMDENNRIIAVVILNFIYKDMSEKGNDTLYLVTDHSLFYE